MAQRPESRLDVVIGTYNRLPQIQRCIDSIRRETRVKTMIYVTDAGSTDGTVEYLQNAEAADLKPLLIGRKLGQAKAYNDVFRIGAAPYVAWLSDDNEIVNAGLDAAVAVLEAEPRVGMVGLKVRDKEGPFVKAPYIGGISSAGVLNVNQGVLRADVLRDVGYFSERFGFYGIDPDLTAKILYAGHDVVYTRDVAIHHYRNWPADKGSPEWAALQKHHEKSEQIYRAKYGAMGKLDPVWQTRRVLWKLAREAMGPRFPLNSTEKFLGLMPRDWHNTLASRHVSLLDPWLTRGKAYHLRQRTSPLSRPRHMPQDPELPLEPAQA